MSSIIVTRVNGRGRVTGDANLLIYREADEVTVKLGMIRVLVSGARWASLVAGTLPEIAELLPAPCGEPGIADGRDMCPCGSGQVWPCNLTRAAWLTRGLDPDAEMRKVLDKAKAAMAAEQAEWETLNDRDPDAARRYARRNLGW